LLRVASRDQACIEIFNILFNVFHNKPHASKREFIPGSLSVNFITYFTVIQTKTYIFHVSTLQKSICDKTTAKNRWSLPKTMFSGVETTFRHTFPSSDLQCLPPDDPRVLFANTGIRLLAVLMSSFSFSFTHVNSGPKANPGWYFQSNNHVISFFFFYLFFSFFLSFLVCTSGPPTIPLYFLGFFWSSF